MKIGTYSYEEYIEKVISFHGSVAPGMIAGGFMVDLARTNLPPGEFFDVICEASHCLPDAVQILTPCTIGNGWLKIVPTGRFAVIFFEKHTGAGTRVFMDPEKLEKWSEIKSWFFRIIPKHQQDSALLVSQLQEAGNSIYSIEQVTVKERFITKIVKETPAIILCPSCGEAYPENFGVPCPACAGNGPCE